MDDHGITIASHSSPMGRWELASRLPHPCLRPHIRRYGGYREDMISPVGRREVPTAGVTLILSLGEQITLERPGSPLLAGSFTSFIAGLHDGPVLTEHAGRQHGIQVDLTPLGTYAVFGVEMRDLANTAVGLGDLLGRQAGQITDRLTEAPDWDSRFQLLDRFMVAWLAAGRVPSPAVNWAWRRLSRSGGRVTVSDLAAEIGWSQRHLAVRFREQVGLPPKAVARVFRFRRAVRLLGAPAAPGTSADGRLPLAEVALACGYYDQAHLSREFRALAGCTPTAYLATRLSNGDIPGQPVGQRVDPMAGLDSGG